MVRSAVAILVGFLTPAVLVTLTDVVMGRLVPAWYPDLANLPEGATLPVGGLALGLAYGFAFAVLGGYLTARLAPREPLRHVAILAGLIVAFGIVSAYAYSGLLPVWYSVGVVALGVVGVYAGARLFMAARQEARL